MSRVTSSFEDSSGSIDALFSGAESTASDAAAAAALAEAFSESTPGSALLEGAPAHRALDELSLDEVFSANTPSPTETQPADFSFEQFFAGEGADPPAPPSPSEGSPPPDGADDIAQFNAWLNGLKKT
jgi:hypothetical protein